jgi:hypothetical protein
MSDRGALGIVRSGEGSGTSSGIMRCLSVRRSRGRLATSWIEAAMARRQEHQRQIVETPTEVRQAETGPSVLALLTVSTGLAVLILGVLRFVFFRT